MINEQKMTVERDRKSDMIDNFMFGLVQLNCRIDVL